MVESAKYLLQLNKEQVAKFGEKVEEIASPAGWSRVKELPSALTDAHILFKLNAPQ